MLIDTLTADLITARKAQDEIQMSILRVWLSECDAARGRQSVGKNLDDQSVVRIGHKIYKNMQESYELTKDNRYLAESQNMFHYLRPFIEKADNIDIGPIIDKLRAENPEKEINEKSVGWFVGQVMKVTNGQANAGIVKERLLGQI